jgi:hypothetical protein
METTSETYRVPDRNLRELEDRIAHLNKRAARLHLQPITLSIVGEEDVKLYREDPLAAAPDLPRTVEVEDDEHEARLVEWGYRPVGVRRYYSVEIEGQDPVLAGWRFAATLQHLPPSEEADALVIVRNVPGVAVPEKYREADPLDCDHCHLRIWRRDTYLLEHVESGTFRQVGSTCIGDFLGHADPHALAQLAELLAEAGRWASAAEDSDESIGGGEGGGCPRYLVLEEYLSYAALAVRECGWVSRRNSDGGFRRATADTALDCMFPPKGIPADELRHRTDEDLALAKEAAEWAASLYHEGDRSQLDDYLANVAALGASGLMGWRNAGLAASIIPAWKREKARRLEREELAGSQHVGTVGKRQEFLGRLTFTLGLDTYYGVSTLCKFVSPEGNVLVWFASGDSPAAGKDADGFDRPVAVGCCYRIKATVKKHDERDGIKQTVITRAKLEPFDYEAEAEEERHPDGCCQECGCWLDNCTCRTTGDDELSEERIAAIRQREAEAEACLAGR